MTNIGNGCDDGCGNGFSFEKLAVDLPLIQSRLLQRVAWQDETGASEESVAEMAKTMDCLLPIAKDWFLWLVGQRVPAALKRNVYGVGFTSGVVKVNYWCNHQIPWQITMKGESVGARAGETLAERMGRHIVYSALMARGSEKLGAHLKHFDEPTIRPVDGKLPSEAENRLNVMREAAEVKMREACGGAAREVVLAFEARRLQLIRAIFALMERIPDWVAGYRLESKEDRLLFHFHAAPTRGALNAYPMGIELKCRGGLSLVWWTRQGWRREEDLLDAENAEAFAEKLEGCVSTMLKESVPDAAVALADLQAGREAGVSPLTGIRQKDRILIEVNGTQVVGRIGSLDFSSMTVEILKPYRCMSSVSSLFRPLYPFRGFFKSDIRGEVTKMGLEQARRALADLYEGCRLIEEYKELLRDELKAAKALEAQRRAALPSPAEWGRRKSEIKARRERGELDASGFQKAMVFLKHERQMLEDDVARPMKDFAIEVRRLLGSSCDELCLMDYLNSRVYWSRDRNMEFGEEPMGNG